MSGPQTPTPTIALSQDWRKLNPGQETLWDGGATVWDEGVVLNETHWDTTTQPWVRLL